ncbi:MRNIP protein, partial [Psophia crepitans]|nr:MRNIP protein [Psophia crepitans]
LLPAFIACLLLQVYGEGSGPDCRHHVQKLNLLQGEAEEAISRTSRCVEESVNDSKNIAARCEDQQEGRAEASRWSRYLDKDSEDQEDGEEAAVTERRQFCSRRKNAVEEQRKQQKSFLSSDVQEYAEENGVFQLAKKRKRCLVAVPHDGDAVSGGGMVPADCESIVPEENTQTPTACTKSSKWEKFLSSSDGCSKTAARVTLSPREGSGGLGLHRSPAAHAGTVGRTLPQGTAWAFNKCGASTEQFTWKLPDTMVPSTSCLVEDVLLKEPQSQLVRAGSGVSETRAGRCFLDSTGRANALLNCNMGPKPSSVSCERLFCTGEEFDDDL